MNVVDPVCGKPLDQAVARRCEMVLGQMHYFCSNACHHQFHANMDRYLRKDAPWPRSAPPRAPDSER